MKYRILQAGNHAAYEGSTHQTTYAPTAEAYARAWSSIVGGTAPPDVDFTREAVLFIASGQRPSGGWRIGFAGLTKEGKTLIVDAPVVGPGPDAMVTQVLTSPYIVVVIEKQDVDRVDWRNAPAEGTGTATQ